MSCDVGDVTERLENEQSRATSQLILQPFRRFTYVKAHSPTLALLHLRHSSFSNPSFASPTSLALHLRHLASRRASVVKMLNKPKQFCYFLVEGLFNAEMTTPMDTSSMLLFLAAH